MHEYSKDDARDVETTPASPRARQHRGDDLDRSRAVFGQARAVHAALRAAGEGAPGSAAAGRPTGDAEPAAGALPIKVRDIQPVKQVRGGLEPREDAFGVMDPTFSFSSLSHEVRADGVYLSAVLHCDYHWGVTGHGNVDIADANHPAITADTWSDIADDLDPDLGPFPNAARQQIYWSKAALEAHELEHARDDWEDWGATNLGVRAAIEAWQSNTVRADAVEADLEALNTTGGWVDRHDGAIASWVMEASEEHYGIDDPYEKRAGEVKAYAVGAEVQRKLVARIRARGQLLGDKSDAAVEAEEAAELDQAEQWEAETQAEEVELAEEAASSEEAAANKAHAEAKAAAEPPKPKVRDNSEASRGS